MLLAKRLPGFTLIELLVVIVVLAILAGIVTVAYSDVQRKSRDSARDAALDTVEKALELYYLDHAAYPAVCPSGDNYGCSVWMLKDTLVPDYTDELRNDPNVASPFQYVRAVGGQGFGIRIEYESRPPCKSGVNISPGWWGSTLPTC